MKFLEGAYVLDDVVNVVVLKLIGRHGIDHVLDVIFADVAVIVKV